MFAYCNNNPIVLCDPSDTITRFSNQLCFTGGDIIGGGSINNSIIPFTASIGICFGVGIGPLSIGGQLSVVTDAKGYSELQFSYSAPNNFSSSLPSVDEMLADIASDSPQFQFGGYLAGNISFTNAPSADKLSGPAYAARISVSGLAIDCLTFQDGGNQNRNYGGISLTAGAITPGFNCTMSNTIGVCPLPFTVFDLAESAYAGIWRS